MIQSIKQKLNKLWIKSNKFLPKSDSAVSLNYNYSDYVIISIEVIDGSNSDITVSRGYYDNKKKSWFDTDDEIITDNIIAWMPEPNGYQD